MRKFIRKLLYVIVPAFVLLTILYIILVSHAESFITEMVRRESNGLVKVKINNLRILFREAGLEAKGVHFYTSPKKGLAVSYDVFVKRIRIKLHDPGSLFLTGPIAIDTVIFSSPRIVVNKWKPVLMEKFSLAGQMGKIYDGLNGALDKLDIRYCLLDSGSFKLHDRQNQEIPPIVITDYHLRIDNFSRASTPRGPERVLFTDQIRFRSSGQDIVFPDGRHGIRYARLRINSRKQSLELDSCFLYQTKIPGAFNQFDVFFDTLRLTGVDFYALTRNNLVKADTAICINPRLDLRVELRENKQPGKKPILSKDSMQTALRSLLGDVDIRYAGLQNARMDVKTKLKNKVNSYLAQKNNLILQDITIVNDTTVPLQVGSFRLDMYGYRGYDPDTSYSITFDSILFRNDKIQLSNFALTPTEKNNDPADRKEIHMRSLQIENISWYELLGNKRLEAGLITMIDPDISISTSSPVQSPAPRKPIYRSLHMISDRLDLSRLKIFRARLDFIRDGKMQLRLEGVNTEMQVNQLLASNNINDLATAVDRISFDIARVYGRNNSLIFRNGVFWGKRQIMQSGVFTLQGKENETMLLLGNVSMEGFRQTAINQYHLGRIHWQEGYITIQSSVSRAGDTERISAAPSYEFSADAAEGSNTTVLFKKDRQNAVARLRRIQCGAIGWVSGSRPDIQDLSAAGDKLKISSGVFQASVSEFQLGQEGSLSDINLVLPSSSNRILVAIPKLSFNPDLPSWLRGRPHVSDVLIQEPVVSISKNEIPDDAKASAHFPDLSAERIRILNPHIESLPFRKSLHADLSVMRSSWFLNKLIRNASGIMLDSLHVALSAVAGTVGAHSFHIADDNGAEATLSDISLSNDGAESSFHASVASLTLRNSSINLNDKQKNASLLTVDSIRAEKLMLDKKSGEPFQLSSLLTSSPFFFLNAGNIKMGNDNFRAEAAALSYQHADNKLRFNDFSFSPSLNKDAFLAKHRYQTDYIGLLSPVLTASGFSPDMLQSGSSWRFQNILLDHPRLYVYRDKRLPFQEKVFRSLPTAQLQNIAERFSVDSVRWNQGAVTYEEMNDKTLRSGKVAFADVNAVVANIRNYDLQPGDSLRLSATALFMDSARLRMNFQESYTDTLHGFSLRLRLSPFPLTALNPVLEPLASFRILSGRLDTFRMNAVGRDHVAHGNMRLYYTGLRSQILEKGREENPDFFMRLANFAANNFIIKRNNSKGLGEVYFERDSSRSVFNYWVKMILSGVSSSTGIKSNNKMERQYGRALKKYQVPVIPDAGP